MSAGWTSTSTATSRMRSSSPWTICWVRIDELPQDKNLLFICAAGVRSGLACEMAAAMGYDTDKLYNIEDGTPPWIEKGYPTSYGLES